MVMCFCGNEFSADIKIKTFRFVVLILNRIRLMIFYYDSKPVLTERKWHDTKAHKPASPT